MALITTMDFYSPQRPPLEPTQRAARAPDLEAVGIRSDAEATVYTAIKTAGGLRSDEAVIRATGLNEAVAKRVLKNLQERRVIRRATDRAGLTTAYVVAR